MLDALVLGWILTWFSIDDLFVDAINQIFNTGYNTSIYWLVFFIIGIIVVITKK